MYENKFAHTHVHSGYSLLDGLSSIPALVKHAKKHGMDAIAVTDHGNLYGAVELLREADKVGIKPIVGLEAYCAPHARQSKERGGCNGKETAFHLTLLAKNGDGLRNLIRLSSKSFLEGYYYKPRIDKQILEQHSEGIICLSGCVGSEFSDLLLHDKFAEAEKLAIWFQSIFKKNYFIEIQDNGIQIQRDQMERAVDLANRLGMPIVATSDAHYIEQSDAPSQDILLCCSMGKKVNDPDRMKFETNQFHIASPDEMYARMPGHHEALKRTVEIAESVEGYDSFELTKRKFPSFAPPDKKTPDQYLRELCLEGMKDRYGVPTQEANDRLDHELGIVSRMGFSAYFLIVSDFVRWANSQGIPCSARGSACGSILSYVLGLSRVCPIKYNLLFERFIDEQRAEAPDIDIDTCKERRGEIIEYIRRKYGEDKVCQIGTIGTMQARGAIRDVSRTLDIPLDVVDKVTKLIPEVLHVTIKESLEQSAELQAMVDSDESIARLIGFASKLEGTARSAGTHAAGIIISDQPLCDLVPLQRTKIKGTESYSIASQWVMKDVEYAGLLKVDLLGLRNLTVLNTAIRLINERRPGRPFALRDMPLDDAKTFEMLCRGETKGVFQLESSGMSQLLVRLKPDSIDHLIAIVSLYRPGPLDGGVVDSYVDRKNGKEDIPSLHPLVDDILDSTYGVMSYQEQAMFIMHRLGDMPLTDSYKVIKAISKKKTEDIEKARSKFVSGSVANGLLESKANEIFDLIVFFGGYSFNKSHGCAYADLAYTTAYLKANYSVEFMAALLSTEMDGAERDKYFTDHIDDCKRMGIEVLPPDLNKSRVEFSIETNDSIRFGLLALKGLGENAAKSIVRCRTKPYKSITDVFERIPSGAMNQSGAEALVSSGALDSLGAKRSQWLSILTRSVKGGKSTAKHAMAGQNSLLDLLDDEETQQVQFPDIPELPAWDLLRREKEILGVYLSGSPIDNYADVLNGIATRKVSDIENSDGKVRLGGMISAIKERTTKKGDKMAILTFEDTTGSCPMVLWPESYANLKHLISDSAVVFIDGKIDRKRDAPQVIVDDIIPVECAGTIAKCILVELQEAKLIRDVISLVHEWPGDRKLYLEIMGVEPRVIYEANLRVDACPDFLDAMRKITPVRIIGPNTKPSGGKVSIKRFPEDFKENL